MIFLKLHLSSYDNSKDNYNEALGIFHELDDLNGIGNSLIGLAGIAIKGKYYDQAQSNYIEALEIFRKTDNRSFYARTLYYLGEIAYFQRNFAKSQERYEEALAIYNDLGDKENSAGVLKKIKYVSNPLLMLAWSLYQKLRHMHP